MRYTYKLYMTPEEDDPGYTVECEDLPGLVTYGRNFTEAVGSGADAMATYIATLLTDGEEIPPATDYPAPDGTVAIWVSVETDASYVMGPCVPSSEAARMLGVSPGRVSQLVSSGALRSNRKGGHVYVEVASIEARLSKGHKAGRPKRQAVAV